LHYAQVMPCILVTLDPDVCRLPADTVDATQLGHIDPAFGSLPTALPFEDELHSLGQCIRPFPHPESVRDVSSQLLTAVRDVSDQKCQACSEFLPDLWANSFLDIWTRT